MLLDVAGFVNMERRGGKGEKERKEGRKEGEIITCPDP